ncbi:MAG TPA: lysophospholipid acyltransferase family protein [Polyangiaceae bacterium]|nr:lysophospholipid acyltransferase family protein [Polyangiaceae bacterium]
MVHPRTYGIFAYLGVFGAAFGGAALAAALLGDDSGRVWWPLSRLGSAGMLEACGVTSLRVEGDQHLFGHGPSVVMVNHESLFDPAVVMRVAREPVRFVVKGQVRRTPIFGRALAAMGHVFVDRGEGDAAEATLDRAARAIAEGRTVLVFPEGTRSEGGALLPFRTGGARLALRARVPIVPAALAGTGAILPKHGGFQRRGPVAFVVGEPLPTASFEDATALSRVAEERVEALRRRARTLCDLA